MAKSSGRWKRHEREIAAMLGGIRIPNNGEGQPDVLARHLAVQVKTKLNFPKWLTDAVDQSIRDAPAGMQPVVVLSHGAQGVKARRLLVVDLDTVLSPAGAESADEDYEPIEAAGPNYRWTLDPACWMCEGTGRDSDDELCRRCDGEGRAYTTTDNPRQRKPSEPVCEECGEPMSCKCDDDEPSIWDTGAIPGCECGCGGDTLDWSRLP